jgi:hypothetical protein
VNGPEYLFLLPAFVDKQVVEAPIRGISAILPYLLMPDPLAYCPESDEAVRPFGPYLVRAGAEEYNHISRL